MLSFNLQAKKFLTLTEKFKISSKAQALYFQLLNIFEKHLWRAKLKINNSTLHQTTSLSRLELNRARQELCRLHLIQFTAGSGSAAGEYIIFDISQKKVDDIYENIKIASENEAEFDNLRHLAENCKNLCEEKRFWAEYIINVLRGTIEDQRYGVFANDYIIAQEFLKLSEEVTFEQIKKLIITLEHNESIYNKPAYILTCLKNCIAEGKKNRH